MDKEVLIQKYLQGTLNQEEEALFQEYKEKDASFADAIPFYEELNYAFAKADYDTTKTQLRSFYKEERRSTWRKWSIAATFLILIGLSSVWYLKSTSSTESLYAQYFEPYKNVVQPIVRGEAVKTTKELAFKAYDEQNYKEAIVYFDDLLSTTPEPIIEFYKANAQLQLGETETAILTLESRIKKTDTMYAEAQWYLALSYLKLNDKKKAEAYLKSLLQTNIPFKNKEAQLLLDQLE